MASLESAAASWRACAVDRINAGSLESTGKSSSEPLRGTFEGANKPTEYSLDPTPICTRKFSSSRLSIAPMMEVTDRHFRWMIRQLSKKCKLYTEMIVDQTLLYNLEPLAAQNYFLEHDVVEHPMAVQLGGNDPDLLGRAAYHCQAFGGFDEINLNCGCPSPKVSERCFGARLMLDPERVRQIVASMVRQATATEVTVKCRIGADQRDSYEELVEFVHACKAGGARHLIIHARKCLLSGLSAAQNRSVPPLHYEVVHRLCRDFPDMTFSLNGGVMTAEEGLKHLEPTFGDDSGVFLGSSADGPLPPCHGVMIGRAVWHAPWSFRNADSAFFGARDPMQGRTRRDLIDEYCDYAERIHEVYGDYKGGDQYGWPATVMLRPLLGLFHGEPGTARFKDVLNAGASVKGCNLREVLDNALLEIPLYVVDSPAL